MANDTFTQMMLDAGGSPAPASPAPSTVDQMMLDAQSIPGNTIPAPPADKSIGRSLLDAANAVSTGLGRGLVRTFNPADVLANINDLGKAAIGAPYRAITGKTPPDWLQVQNRAQTPGSAEWLLAQAAKNPVSSALVNPSDPRYEGGYLQAAGAGLAGIMNPASVSAAAGQATRGVLSSLAGKGAYDLTGSEPLAIAASLAPGAAGRQTTSAPVTPRSQVLADAQAKGFVVPPSAAGNTSWTNSLLETLAGNSQLKQDANYRNAHTRATVAGESVGVPAGTPVTADALATLRAQRGAQGYAPISNLGDIPTGVNTMTVLRPGEVVQPSNFQLALDKINRDRGMSQSMDPTLQNDTVAQATSAYAVPTLTGDQINTAIQQQRTIGNRQANTKYGGNVNDVPVGEARIDISKALENLVNEHLMDQGPSNIVPNLLQARKDIAQNYTVDKALANPDSGDVNAKPFVDRYKNELPLEGDQLLLGKFGAMYPEYNKPNVNTQAPLTSTGNAAAIAAGVGGGYLAGGLKGALLGATPALRVPARHMLLSDWYQKNFANPSDTSNWSIQLTPEQRGALSQSLLSSGLLKNP
jgi:hypothetical protein